MGDCLDDEGNEDNLFEEPDSVADDDAEYYDEDNNFLFNTWNNEINSKNPFALSQISIQSPNNLSDLTSGRFSFHPSVSRIQKGKLMLTLNFISRIYKFETTQIGQLVRKQDNPRPKSQENSKVLRLILMTL